jgi:hypothetical protein
MNEDEKILETQLMIYTRSYSFDYSWVYGHRNAKIQKELETLFRTWITNKLLNNLWHEVTFFSQIDGYFILLIASPSNRVDNVKRAIFDRAMFLWQPNHKLVYRDLYPLVMALTSKATEVYETLTSDATTIKTDYQNGFINLRTNNADQSTEEVENFTVAFPSGITWKDIRQQNLIAEFPTSLKFSEIVQLIGDYPLEETLTICHGVSVEDRYPKDKSCIVSATNRNSSEVLVLNRNLQLYLTGKIQESIISKPNSSFHPAHLTPQKTQVEPNLVPPNKTEIPSTSNDEEKLVDFLNELAKKISIRGDEKSNIILQQIRVLVEKISLSQRKQLLKLITELLYLLNPAGAVIPVEINILWQNLFTEILLLQGNSSNDIRKSWIQRISLLKPITFSAISNLKLDKWESEFNEKCNQLRDALSDIGSKKRSVFGLNE